MDGFDLARNIRADATLHDLPIIMITSRIAQKHREHAIELGVNHYLGKPYSDDELLSLIQHYAQQAQAAQPRSGSYPVAGRASGGLNGPSVGAIFSLT
jgi:chemosensory pili system protein ChpA (sensor histidine kinase/response regulator)